MCKNNDIDDNVRKRFEKLRDRCDKHKDDPVVSREPVFHAYGWLCPRCGRGNGPFTSTCPCVPLPPPVVTF
jgi:hypothetical protein